MIEFRGTNKVVRSNLDVPFKPFRAHLAGVDMDGIKFRTQIYIE